MLIGKHRGEGRGEHRTTKEGRKEKKESRSGGTNAEVGSQDCQGGTGTWFNLWSGGGGTCVGEKRRITDPHCDAAILSDGAVRATRTGENRLG